MSTHVYCALDSKHEGPYARYMWNVYRRFAGKKTASVADATSQQGFLCEECARSVGAWALPEKKEEGQNVSK